MKQIFSHRRLWLIPVIAAPLLLGLGERQAYDTSVKSLDFAPRGGGTYNIDWAGPPRRDLAYSDVRHYVPRIELTRPTPRRIILYYEIYESRFFGDTTLGYFWADIPGGATVPSQIVYLSDGGEDARVPTGAPQQTIGSFWLGCTKKGITRGNLGKGDSHHAAVYFKSFSIMGTPEGPVTVGGDTRSNTHDVYCS